VSVGFWLLVVLWFLLLLSVWGCASFTPVYDQPRIETTLTSEAETRGTLSPVVNQPVVQSPTGQAQGFLSGLYQHTVSGISPWGFVLLLMWQTYLSHRRERLRILHGRRNDK